LGSVVRADEPGTGRPRGPYAGAAERRAAIVEAAFTVFAAHGYAGGSLQKVADVVGMSQTSLLHYFPKKSDLLLAVLQRRDEMAEVVVPSDGEAFVDAVLRQARANETIHGVIELYTVLAGEAVTRGNPGRGYVAQRLASVRNGYTQMFHELAAAGRLRPGMTPEVAAASLVALWDGLQLQWLLAPEVIDVAGHLKSFFDVLVLPDPSVAPGIDGLDGRPE
jgi:AcrR family transcriptional regulator